MKKKDKNKEKPKEPELEETAVALAVAETQPQSDEADGDGLDLTERKQKISPIKMIDGWVNTAKNIEGTVTEIYHDWIKPVRDNWSQIKRRMNVIITVISIVFFILYVPFLLFSKLSKDLSLGWDVALYVCISVYVATIVALFIVSLVSGRSTSVAMEKKRKQISKFILLGVRLASLAIGVTTLIISAMSGASDKSTAVIDTIAIIFAVTSIIFTAIPLIFGGIGGFIKWLISPAKMKFKFSFVVLEWYQSFTSNQVLDKNTKKLAKRYGERVGGCIDKYFLPSFGNKYIKSVDENTLAKLLEAVPQEDMNMCEWIIKRVFDYAEECGYVDNNPCDKIELIGDIAKENKARKQAAVSERPSFVNKMLDFFKLKKPEDKEDIRE